MDWHLTLTLAWHSVGFQLPPLLTQPLNSMDINFSTSCILGTDWSTYKRPTAKVKLNKEFTLQDYWKGAFKTALKNLIYLQLGRSNPFSCALSNLALRGGKTVFVSDTNLSTFHTQIKLFFCQQAFDHHYLHLKTGGTVTKQSPQPRFYFKASTLSNSHLGSSVFAFIDCRSRAIMTRENG